MIKNDNNKISTYQLCIYLILTIVGIGNITLPRELALDGDTNGWIALIVSGFLILIITHMICYVSIKVNKDNFLEVSKSVFGKIIAYIIVILCAIYFIILCGIEVRSFGELLKGTIFDATPISVLMILFLAAAVLITVKGLEAIARFFEIMFVLLVVSVVLMFVITIPGIDITNIFPIMNITGKQFIKLIGDTFYSLTGFEILMIIFPHAKSKYRSKKYALWSIVIVVLFYILLDIVVQCKYGVKLTGVLIWPVMSILKDIYIKDAFIENPVMISILFCLTAVFTTLVAYMYGAFNIIKSIINTKKSKYDWWIVIGISIAIYIVAIIPANYHSEKQIKDMFSIFLIPIITFVLPILMYLIVKIKERMGKINGKKG